jgi:alkyl hydroperoxide reductase subunit AhpF
LVELNEHGEIAVDHQTGATSRPGVFAAGDVTDDRYKQNNIAAGDGVRAALSAYHYLIDVAKRTKSADNTLTDGLAHQPTGDSAPAVNRRQ